MWGGHKTIHSSEERSRISSILSWSVWTWMALSGILLLSQKRKATNKCHTNLIMATLCLNWPLTREATGDPFDTKFLHCIDNILSSLWHKSGWTWGHSYSKYNNDCILTIYCLIYIWLIGDIALNNSVHI